MSVVANLSPNEMKLWGHKYLTLLRFVLSEWMKHWKRNDSINDYKNEENLKTTKKRKQKIKIKWKRVPLVNVYDG